MASERVRFWDFYDLGLESLDRSFGCSSGFSLDGECVKDSCCLSCIYDSKSSSSFLDTSSSYFSSIFFKSKSRFVSSGSEPLFLLLTASLDCLLLFMLSLILAVNLSFTSFCSTTSSFFFIDNLLMNVPNPFLNLESVGLAALGVVSPCSASSPPSNSSLLMISKDFSLAAYAHISFSGFCFSYSSRSAIFFAIVSSRSPLFFLLLCLVTISSLSVKESSFLDSSSSSSVFFLFQHEQRAAALRLWA
jgi:hypothetical protein